MARGGPDINAGTLPNFVIEYAAGQEWLQRGGGISTETQYTQDLRHAKEKLANLPPRERLKLVEEARKQLRTGGGFGPGTLNELNDENPELYDELIHLDLDV